MNNNIAYEQSLHAISQKNVLTKDEQFFLNSLFSRTEPKKAHFFTFTSVKGFPQGPIGFLTAKNMVLCGKKAVILDFSSNGILDSFFFNNIEPKQSFLKPEISIQSVSISPFFEYKKMSFPSNRLIGDGLLSSSFVEMVCGLLYDELNVCAILDSFELSKDVVFFQNITDGNVVVLEKNKTRKSELQYVEKQLSLPGSKPAFFVLSSFEKTTLKSFIKNHI